MAFLSVWLMIGILWVWVLSARPMLYRFGHWLAPSIVPAWVSDTPNTQRAQPTAAQIVFPVQPGEGAGLVIASDVQPTPLNPVVQQLLPTQHVQVVVEMVTPTPPPVTPQIESTISPAATFIAPVRLPAAQYCPYCDVHEVKVRITHYWPLVGSENCWTFNQDTGWCDSAMASELRWENFIGVAAACPKEWPFGTWIEIPAVGSFVCLDRGAMICTQDYCEVDILTQDLGVYDGQTFTAKIYVNWR